MVPMRLAVAMLLLTACHQRNHDDSEVDAGMDFNQPDAMTAPRNQCMNMPGVLLAARVDIPVGMGPYGIAVADFNGDMLPDLAIATQQPGGFTALLNASPGCDATFQPFLDIPTEANVHNVVTADFNMDGKPDVAAVSQLYDIVTVMLDTTPMGGTMPIFSAGVDFATGTNASWLAVGDVNGDGKAGSRDQRAWTRSRCCSISRSPAMPRRRSRTRSICRTPARRSGSRSRTSTATAGSISPSSTPTTTRSRSISNTTAGITQFAAIRRQPFPTGNPSPFAIAIGDFDGDHKPDIAVANIKDDSVSVLLNTTDANATTPSFAAKVDLPTGMRPYAIAVGDINRDGMPDIVAACETLERDLDRAVERRQLVHAEDRRADRQLAARRVPRGHRRRRREGHLIVSNSGRRDDLDPVSPLARSARSS